MPESRKQKNQKIRESFIKTKEKRKSQICKVFTIKIQNNKLKTNQIEALKMQFVEAKWIVNSVLAWSEIPENKIWEYKIGKTVIHKDKDMNDIETELKFLGSQVKQSVIAEIISNIRTLSTLKKKGKKVGKLKFRKEVKELNFKQHGISYKIVNKNTIKIQNIPGKIHVNGLDQILNGKHQVRKDIDIANAKLLNKQDGYYLAITTYWNKTERKHNNKEVGIDFGIKEAITLSDGRQFDSFIQESDRLKRLQRKLARQQGKTLTCAEKRNHIKKQKTEKKWSKGCEKTVKLIRKEYQKLTNKKNDAANKVIHEIMQFKHIFMQDENITGWQKGRFGKKVQHSILGRVKAKIKPNATYVLDKFEPTTKFCYNCGQIKSDITLGDRVYICDCGIKPEDRDIHAAKNMIVLSKIKLGMERTEFTPMDIEEICSRTRSTTVSMVEVGRSCKGSKSSKELEDAPSLAEH